MIVAGDRRNAYHRLLLLYVVAEQLFQRSHVLIQDDECIIDPKEYDVPNKRIPDVVCVL